MWKRIAAGIGLVLIVPVILFATFGSTSVCDQCACESSDTDFQFPLLPLTLWRHHTEHSTPLGELGVEFGFVPPHAHHWRFVAGGGNGIVCALGGVGRDFDRAARSENIVDFIRRTERFRGREEARAWFNAALDERRSAGMRKWLEFVLVDKMTSKANYEERRKFADRFAAEEWPELVGDGLIARPKP